ncbi:MAG: FAD-dependent oxidoreductase [Candidatus Dormibacteraeota bacterium]|uniref:FAD-dependent oxidoreductase n=1 Tax=Candidatus Aeolococcus gillhamiae TaxID=3127015 RepID=A0A934K0D3_9BACT|nr:FAD-dependent oxidoreductase [Candidatus Dormibacteraeota bacterium]
MNHRYSYLFEPLIIRTHRIPNRIVMCAMNDNLAFPDGYPTEQQIDYYTARAAGGVGLMITGNAYIDEQASKISANQLGCQDDRLVSALARLVESVHAHGTVLIIQLAHAGPQTLPETIGFRQMVAPSAGEHASTARALSLVEIGAIVESFVAAARRAESAGFDGVELHCGHGYLLSSFLSPQVNLRTDQYGGSLENRARIIREIIERARAVVGSAFIIGAKFNSSDLVAGGFTVEDSLAFAQMLATVGVDYLGVSRGIAESSDHMIAPLYYERHQNVSAARAIRDAVSIPVIAMGAILDPGDADAIIERGDADLVAIGRGLIADPDWPTKAKRGAVDDIRPCIRCNECVALVDENRELRCAVNPHVGHDGKPLMPTREPLSVLVLGGGPAGCEAARTAALRGHRVTLLERHRLGGASVPEANPPFKRELNRLPVWYERQLEKAGVKVVLNIEASLEAIRERDPDVIVYAIGADPLLPQVGGVDTNSVVQATELLESPPPRGLDIAVVGAGFVGCETALHLAQNDNRVALVTRRGRDQVASDLNYTMKLALLREMGRADVTIVDHAIVQSIGPGKVSVLRADGSNGTSREEGLVADLVVLARGFAPQRLLADTLIDAGYDVRVIGEANRTGLIFHAVQQGFAVGSTI